MGEVLAFKDVIEKLTGNKITAEKLGQAIELVNQRRLALQRLYNLRKVRPVPISGKDALLATQVSFYDDAKRDTQMLNALCDELDKRVAAGQGVAPANAPRILISGSPMAIPNWKLHHIHRVGRSSGSLRGILHRHPLLQRSGETDSRITWTTQLKAIADRYMNIHCACFTPNDERLDDVVKLAKEYQVDGVVHYNLQFCHTYANEAVKMEKRLEKEGIPFYALRRITATRMPVNLRPE